jgi:hypothetical protein
MGKYVPTTKELLITLWIIILIAWWTWIFCSWLKPNEFGDAINPIVWIITIVLVYRTYKLQEKELRETTTTLQNQEWVMQEQRFQDTFSLLIKTAQDHFNSIKITVEEQKRDNQSYSSSTWSLNVNWLWGERSYFELHWWAAIIYLLNKDDLHKYSESWTLGNFKKYINTLWVIENLVDNGNEKINKEFYINLAKTQINEAEKKLYKKLRTDLKKFDLFELSYLMSPK